MEHHGSGDDKPAGVKLCVSVVHIDDVEQVYKIECEVFLTWLDGKPDPRAKDEIHEYDEKEFLGEGEARRKSVGSHSHVPKPEFYHCENIEHVDDNVYARNSRTGRCFVQYNMLVTLRERLELHRFPFDRQLFKISMWPDNAKFVHWEDVPLYPGETAESLDWSEIKDARLPGKEWDIKTLLECNQWKLEKTMSTLTADGEKLVVQVGCSRDPSFVLSNIVLVNFFVVPTAMTSVGLDPVDDLADRINLTLTCILTVVAFKFVMTSMIPAVSYLTMLDRYMLFTFFLLGMSVLESFLVSVASKDDNALNIEPYEAEQIDQYFHLFLFGFWLLLHQAILIGYKLKWFVLGWDAVAKADNAEQDQVITEVLQTEKEKRETPSETSASASFGIFKKVTEGAVSVELSAHEMVENPMPPAKDKS